ncbi:MAG: DMT family transporter [Chloroflexi bacterium]|nr:DMT family transporter [Chloroflexota bacterium]
MISILYGLTSALTWGAADFCGGLASRKTKAYQAVLFGEVVGLALLLAATFLSGEAPIGWFAWLLCSIAGSMGVLGLLLLFHSMTKGQMSVAAPVSALMAAVLPVVVGTFTEGFPGWLTLAGFALALAAIWFISQPEEGPKNMRLRLADLSLPLIAGVSFGVYFILLHRGSQNGLFLPMVSSRLAGVVTMVIYTLVTRQAFLPAKSVWPLLILNGILDVSGNGLYILAGQAGRMDVAAVLASLYPASTVLLAGLFLHERLGRVQVVGVLTALAAIVLMTV